ncbi:MAG TPA: tungsten ABC transporter substrate-binding protein [Clostridiales bacterium]|nr:tungsten ABC transporter substrate-binding protein [Clostridiales bacterium]
MKQNKKLLALLLVLVIAFTSLALVACADKKGDGDQSKKVVRISTTTSVNDSGLMAYLQPYFKADTGYDWEIASAGTGAAIKAAQNGNADVILVHSKKSEEAFVSEGFARVVDGYKSERVSFMYNYFVLVGPNNDPAGVESAATVKTAFANIKDGSHPFISRGDKSGTHNKEVTLWPSGTLNKDGSNDINDIPAAIRNDPKKNPTGWYYSTGLGMGACLTMANETNAYVLTDKATFLSFKNNPDGDKIRNLKILKESDNDLKNTYSMLAVNPNAPFIGLDGKALPEGQVKIDTTAADVFVKWMTSEHAKALIAFYGETKYGGSLFTLMGGYLK